MISLKTHNIFDYIIGAVLIASPDLFFFANVVPARNVLHICGFGLIGYSLITQYFYSFFKIIPIKAHFFLDLLVGATLVVAPYLFVYRQRLSTLQLALHFILGASMIVHAWLTRRTMKRVRTFTRRPELKKVA